MSSLSRKMLDRRPPEGLLELFERIYVFDCCFNTEASKPEDYVINQYMNHFPNTSIIIFNFREGDAWSKIASVLSHHEKITVMDYPQNSKLLSLEVIHHFLKSSESWLSIGPEHVVMMNSEVGGWPVMAFMMAALLIYRNHSSDEFKTLDMVHKQVPRDVLHVVCSVNPIPSQLRYLQYVSTRTTTDRALTLDRVIFKMIPVFNETRRYSSVIRIYGRNHLLHVDKTPKLLFVTQRTIGNFQYSLYGHQVEDEVQIYINRHIQGDIVLECSNLHNATGSEQMMYRVMFNTTFIKSNMLMFNRDEIDLNWDAKEKFSKDFRVELFFSEINTRAANGNVKGGAAPTLPRAPPPLPPKAPPPPPPPPPPTLKARPQPPPPTSVANGNAKNFEGRNTLSRTTAVKIEPTKILRPLYWGMLDKAAEGSLWAKAQESGEAEREPELDMSELETFFSVTKSSCISQEVNKTAKVEVIERAIKCEIMLSKMKEPLDKLIEHLMTVNVKAMDVDTVDNLIKFSPCRDEMQLIKAHQQEKEKFNKCEQFYLETMRVPRFETKLRVFSYAIQFNKKVSDLSKSLNDVYLSAEQIMSSVKLRKVMQIILSLGNALNEGTIRGSCVGFKLDTLLKLNETRDKNNEITVMHYLCKVLADKQPELLDFPNELGSLEAASKIQRKALAEEMQGITKGLIKALHERKVSKKDGFVSIHFRKSLEKFIWVAEDEVKNLAETFSAAGKKGDALILYFGEDPNDCSYEQVITTLLEFVRMFNQAHEENCNTKSQAKNKPEIVQLTKVNLLSKMEAAASPEKKILEDTIENLRSDLEMKRDEIKCLTETTRNLEVAIQRLVVMEQTLKETESDDHTRKEEKLLKYTGSISDGWLML